LSSFSAHSTHAIDFLHKVAEARCDHCDSNEIEELLDSMRDIVDAVKVRRQSTQSLFPLATPITTQHTPAKLPPIQVAVAVIRKAQSNPSQPSSSLPCNFFCEQWDLAADRKPRAV
jgi:hypothetical protein